jgi:hypothetical protein
MDIRLIYTVIALLFVQGCASYQVTTAPALEYDLEVQNNMAKNEGFMLMAKPIHHHSDLEQYFDDDPLKYGILPMQLYVENKDHETAMLCASEGINLMDSANTRVPAMSVDQVMDKVKKSHWRTAGWTVGLGIFGLIPSAVNVNNTNKKMRADYETKMFKGGKLAKGNATEGFLFYSVPEDIKSLDGWRLAAVLKSTDQGSDLILTQALSGTIAPRPKETKAQPTQPAEE